MAAALEHPRRAELDILRGRFTGTVAKNLKTIQVVFFRGGTEDAVKQEQRTNEAQVVHSTPDATAVLAPRNSENRGDGGPMLESVGRVQLEAVWVGAALVAHSLGQLRCTVH